MLVVGLSGGLNWDSSEQFQETSNFLHDAAAVVVRDGQIVAALEEERDNRLKHSNKFPLGAIRHCLHEAGATAADVDRWAYCFGNVLEIIATNAFLADMSISPLVSSEAILAERLSTGLGQPVSPSVNRHRAASRGARGQRLRAVGLRLRAGRVVRRRRRRWPREGGQRRGRRVPTLTDLGRRSRWASSTTTRCGRWATGGSTNTR